MKNHTMEMATETGAPADSPPRINRDRQGLLDVLTVIDSEGWEGPAATALLEYVRTEMVRPLAIDAGLRGAAASQAEATGWETVWVSLTKPSLRTAASPWGVLWQAARRAVLGEIVAATYATEERRGRSLAAAARDGQVVPPTSLDALAATGWEPACATADPAAGLAWRQLLVQVDAALVDAGWDPIMRDAHRRRRALHAHHPRPAVHDRGLATPGRRARSSALAGTSSRALPSRYRGGTRSDSVAPHARRRRPPRRRPSRRAAGDPLPLRYEPRGPGRAVCDPTSSTASGWLKLRAVRRLVPEGLCRCAPTCSHEDATPARPEYLAGRVSPFRSRRRWCEMGPPVVSTISSGVARQPLGDGDRR
jgi:hypothetical protein